MQASQTTDVSSNEYPFINGAGPHPRDGAPADAARSSDEPALPPFDPRSMARVTLLTIGPASLAPLALAISADSGFQPTLKFRDRRWLHLGLLLFTLVTTTLVGADHYAAFLSDFQRGPLPLAIPQLIVRGFWYSGTILLILGTHELGHYLACRYYQVDASLPFFIPAPLLTGTLGAFIRIREPIPTKRMLFDIGAAGPFAGFVFAVPALFIGLSLSHVVRIPDNFPALWLGEPLLFKAAAWLTWGPIPDGYSLNMHPMAFAAWFGLLATALNLFPVGQLDGGHIAYAVLGRRSTQLTLVAIGATIALTFVSTSWLVWTVLMILMTMTFGPRHPRTLDEHVPLDRPRIWLALAALVIFVLCFTPNPIEPMDLLQQGREGG